MSLTNFSAASDKGRHRSNNEDSYLSLPEKGLWLVADGMGGHAAGEVASAIVVETIQKSTEERYPLEESIQSAHQSVLDAVTEGSGGAGMGSTVVALLSGATDYQLAWVGDSRAYLWTPHGHAGTLEQLSTDHSYVQMLLTSGAIGEDEAVNHPDKNVITQCIGAEDIDQVQVDSVKGQWKPGEWILLCSDGLTDELDDEEIAGILCESETVQEAVDQLLHEALRKGGRDNITIQIVESPVRDPSTPNRSLLPFLRERAIGNTGAKVLPYLAALLCITLLGYWFLT